MQNRIVNDLVGNYEEYNNYKELIEELADNMEYLFRITPTTEPEWMD
ncbi:MAG: hypothetical protein IJ730_00695 [Alphaproteobacteria bacterium]|nr:hypothetical protein [Alphaproteobacteria bacterium]